MELMGSYAANIARHGPSSCLGSADSAVGMRISLDLTLTRLQMVAIRCHFLIV